MTLGEHVLLWENDGTEHMLKWCSMGNELSVQDYKGSLQTSLIGAQGPCCWMQKIINKLYDPLMQKGRKFGTNYANISKILANYAKCA